MQTTILAPGRAKDVDRWAKGNVSASLVKSNNGRDVWRVSLGKPALYVKRFPKELLRDRATKEAELLQALHKAGIPAPLAVATAVDKKGSYILTEEVPDCRPLSELLRDSHPRCRSLLQDLGRLARKLHDAGFDHQDFHAGNVLVRDADLYVIDVHRADRNVRFSQDKRLDRVAFTAMSFIELRPRSDFLRFLRAYGITDAKQQIQTWGRVRELHHDYFLGRQERVFKDGTGFGVKGNLYFRKGVDLDPILTKVKNGNRETVRRTRSETLHRVDPDLFLKTTSPRRAKKIWENAHGLALRGIDTPRLFAWQQDWVAGEWIPSVDLHEHIQANYGTLGRSDRDAFLFRFARIVRRLHDYGAYHGDLKAGNVLVGSGRIALIDLDRVRFEAEVPDGERIFNLAQLNAAVCPPLTKSDRLRFLDYYIGNCATLRKRRGDWVRGIMGATRARKHRWPLK